MWYMYKLGRLYLAISVILSTNILAHFVLSVVSDWYLGHLPWRPCQWSDGVAHQWSRGQVPQWLILPFEGSALNLKVGVRKPLRNHGLLGTPTSARYWFLFPNILGIFYAQKIKSVSTVSYCTFFNIFSITARWKTVLSSENWDLQ